MLRPSAVCCVMRPKIILSPSFDQFTSICVSFSDTRRCDEPPWAGTIKIAQGCLGSTFTYAICFPSGDQRGRAALPGGKVNCCCCDPSLRQRQRLPSGTETYVTHCRSAEKSRSLAEMPDRNGTYLPDVGSYFTTAPRIFSPRVQSFLLSAASTGRENEIAPSVSLTGFPYPFVSDRSVVSASAKRFPLLPMAFSVA